MMETNVTKPQISIRKLQNKFKCFIKKEALEKIEFFCDKISTTEWSGVLFYTIDGSMKDINSLVVNVIDVFLLDIGTAGATDYEYEDDYIQYRVQNPQLLEEGIFIGHIHSHNSMATFFSGTDTGELTASAPLHNVFVSLIVNNAGTYSIGLSVQGKYKSTSVIEQTINFNDFSGDVCTFDPTTTNQVVNEEVIYHAFGTIEKEVTSPSIFSRLLDRITKVKEKKYKPKESTNFNSSFYTNNNNKIVYPGQDSGYGYSSFKPSYEKPTGSLELPFNNLNSYTKPKTDEEELFEEYVDWLEACILYLGLFQKHVSTKWFVNQLEDSDEIVYTDYLTDILEMAENAIFNGDYEYYLNTLNTVIKNFEDLEFVTNCKVLKTIISILKEYKETLEIYIEEESTDDLSKENTTQKSK